MWQGLAGTLSMWVLGAVALRLIVVPGATCPSITPDQAVNSARASASWIERVQRPDGSYLYEYDAEAGAEVPGYNIVRHAGVTMSLYQLAAEGYPEFLPAADRGLGWMEANLTSYEDWTGLAEPGSGAVRLGANALLVAGLAQRRLATGDASYDDLMRAVSRYMLVMQLPDGAFLDTWLPATQAPLAGVRSKYATGEAFWALTLMHRIFPDEGWDRPARAVADYLACCRDSHENLKFPPWADQWAAYGLAELSPYGLSDRQIAYARTLAERFGFLVRNESQRTNSWFSKLFHGREARAAGAGTWLEALDSLSRLAATDARMSDMHDDLVERTQCMAGILRERQVTTAKAGGYADPNVALGAWFTEGKTRMDDQQHALSALIRSRPLLAEPAP